MGLALRVIFEHDTIKNDLAWIIINIKNKLLKKANIRLKKYRKKVAKIRKRYFLRVLKKYYLDIEGYNYNTSNDYIIKGADIKTIQIMNKQYGKEVSDKKYRILVNRVKKGSELCIIVLNNEDFIYGYSHVACADHCNTRINYMVKLKPWEVYFFDDYVFKEHRNQGVHSFSISQRLSLVKELGFLKAITIIEADNISSHTSYCRFGFLPNETLLYFPLIKKTLALRKIEYKSSSVDK